MPVVWISGGARRLGKGLALRFAERGFDVSLTYRTSMEEAQHVQGEIQALGRACHIAECDVRSESQLRESLDACTRELGVPDVIVSNVGVFPARTPIPMLNEQDLVDALAVNTIPLLTISRVYHELCSSHNTQGRIVSMGSLGAHEIWRNRIAYNVSKSALHTMVQTLARGLAPMISVNSVAPGIIAQPDEIEEHEQAGLISIERIPMHRHGNVDDVFDAVWFFATATPYITGQTVIVDGGYHLTR